MVQLPRSDTLEHLSRTTKGVKINYFCKIIDCELSLVDLVADKY